MKEYIKPVFESIELKCEERMAGSCNIPDGYTEGHCATSGLY